MPSRQPFKSTASVTTPPNPRPKALTKSRAEATINELTRPASHPRPSRGLFIFGDGDMGQLGLGPDVKGPITRPRLHVAFEDATKKGGLGRPGAGLERAAAGGMHSAVIDEVGRVWSWGVNDGAALGRRTDDKTDRDSSNSKLESNPIIIQSLVDQGFRAVDVWASDSVSVAISDRGVLIAWGSFRDGKGMLGFGGSDTVQFDPVELPEFKKEIFVSAACGANHFLALPTSGRVYSWGSGEQGALGRRIMERRAKHGLQPERLSLRNIVLVGCGEAHSFAMDRDGIVYAWGLNNRRQTGISNTDGGQSSDIVTPTIVRALSPENLQG